MSQAALRPLRRNRQKLEAELRENRLQEVRSRVYKNRLIDEHMILIGLLMAAEAGDDVALDRLAERLDQDDEEMQQWLAERASGE